MTTKPFLFQHGFVCVCVLIQEIAAGFGNNVESASNIFSQLKNTSDLKKNTTQGDVKAFVNILELMTTATQNIDIKNDTVMHVSQ